MKYRILYLTFMSLSMLFTACEQEYIPAPSPDGPKYVVEGHIEAGQNALPAYVILTRTFDFYSEIDPDLFNSSFVHDANVSVFDGTREVVLQELCLSDLDPALREQVAKQFGFDADSLVIDFCVYVDALNQIGPQEGATYELVILVGTDSILATTTIPEHVLIDSLRFTAPPGAPNDTLAQLKAFISDPPGQRNFYRYFGATNGGALETGFSSVEEDLFFDGKNFEFQLVNPATTSGDIEPDEFGLYFVGDTMTIKWCTIDEAHFDFWNTLEFSNANQGPFANYTRLQTNIRGGLGIWGGYSVSYHTLVVMYE